MGGTVPAGILYYTPEQLAAFNKYSNRDNNGTRLDYGTQFALKESVNAFYVQGDLEGEGWSGNVGIRVVQTKESVISTLTGLGDGQKSSDFGALASAISLSPPSTATGIGSGSAANPNLKPIRSNNLDASLEWYYAPRALASGSVYKFCRYWSS